MPAKNSRLLIGGCFFVGIKGDSCRGLAQEKILCRSGISAASPNRTGGGCSRGRISRKDCILQPGVARHELPWVVRVGVRQPQRSCGSRATNKAATLRVETFLLPSSQGSSWLATLGFGSE